MKKRENDPPHTLLTRTLLVIAAFLCFTAAILAPMQASCSEANDDYAVKVSLENQLEMKMKQIIMEVTGIDRVAVFVNAQVTSARDHDDKFTISKKNEKTNLFPGVPEKKEFSYGQSELQLPRGAVGKYNVSRIVTAVWIDKNAPGPVVELVQDIARNVTGFDQSRGDQVNIKKVDFETRKFTLSSLLFPPYIFWLVLTVLGGFVLAVVLLFLNPSRHAGAAFKAAAGPVERTTTIEREVLAPAAVSPEPSREGTAKTAEHDEDALPFSFVRDRDVPGLAFLLGGKAPRDIAAVLNYLEPSIAMKLLEALPMDLQIEAAVMLGSREVFDRDRVHALEEEMRINLRYVGGGEEKLLMLLDLTNEEVRDQIIERLVAVDAGTAERMKRKIMSLEAVLRSLTSAGIQTLVRASDAAVFAGVLKALPEDIRKRVVASLTAGAAERFKQEMDLGRPLSDARLKIEKRNIMSLVRRLISEGILEVELK